MTANEVRSPIPASPQAPWPSPPDPGDLSRRLSTRRAELRLSVAQVAARARIPRRYLEYLEKYPAQPGPVILRRLASALRTTPALLLGATGDPAGGQPGKPGRLERLIPAECVRLLASGTVGRIAFRTAGGLDILPVNYIVIAGTIVLRTSADSLIAAHGDGYVAFEADHLDEALGQGWSILVHGSAHRVIQAGELRNLRQEHAPRPWPEGERNLYIRIVPDRVTGRRIQVQ